MVGACPDSESQARYVGDGGGVAQYEFGSSWGDLAGEYALGEYEGVMSVVADFDAGTVSGCLGASGTSSPSGGT